MRRLWPIVGLAMLIGVVGSITANVMQIWDFLDTESTHDRLRAVAGTFASIATATILLGAVVAFVGAMSQGERTRLVERGLAAAVAVASLTTLCSLFAGFDLRSSQGADLGPGLSTIEPGPTTIDRFTSGLSGLSVAAIAGTAAVLGFLVLTRGLWVEDEEVTPS